MAANPMNNKNLGRTHSKELAKNNRGKRTRKNSDYQTAATAARQAQAHGHALGNVVQCYSQHQQRGAFEAGMYALRLAGAGVQMGH